MKDTLEFGNPYGAGQYCFIRSAEKSEDMLFGDQTQFDPRYNRWFEYFGCGYACGRDGQALQEADDMDIYMFHSEHPKMVCRESFHDLEYGNTRDEVANALFLLMEYSETQYRTFSFDFENITMLEAQAYVEAIEHWHGTGELNIGSFAGIPQYGPWENK